VQEADYAAIEALGKAAAWVDMGLVPPENLRTAVEPRYNDYITYEQAWLEALCAASPHNDRYSARLAKLRQGWYVPPGRVLPLGDNRDNSIDGRYFGTVQQRRILGSGVFKYWPASRIGVIK
jgi:signal peptidase I